MPKEEPLTLATKLLALGILVSVIGGLFILLVEELALNDDCNPCGYYFSLWIFYPLIPGIAMFVIGLVLRRREAKP